MTAKEPQLILPSADAIGRAVGRRSRAALANETASPGNQTGCLPYSNLLRPENLARWMGASSNEFSALRLHDDSADLAAALDLLVGCCGLV
jgi:hypothetical protein